jgi:hypothetical protein
MEVGMGNLDPSFREGHRTITQQTSTRVRSRHKMGLGINLGGTIFGLVTLNPTVKRIGDRRDRGRVLNEAWARFQTIGGLAIGVTVATWRLGGLKGAESDLYPTLAGEKNVLLGGALVTNVASASPQPPYAEKVAHQAEHYPHGPGRHVHTSPQGRKDDRPEGDRI